MKVTFCAAVSLAVLGTSPCTAAFITQSQVVNLRFTDAVTGVPAEPEPLRFGAEAADTIILLDLGAYSSADTGKTFTFMKEPEWNAVAWAMQGDPFNRNTGLPTMWLGTDELEEKEISSSGDLSRGRLSAGSATYNLQRVDITVRYYRTGTDDGIRFRTAAFDATFYWLVPEPATWISVVSATTLLILRRRPVRVRSGVGKVSDLRLKRAWILLSLAVVWCARPAAAEIITVPFSGVVTEVVGDPFGIMARSA
jgi:hypothetical protein